MHFTDPLLIDYILVSGGYELNPNFNKVQNARLTDAVNIYNNATTLKIAA